MEYVVIEKRTNKQQLLKNVVEVTETAQSFRFTLEHGDIWEFNKSRYKYYNLESIKRPTISKEKLVDILNKFFSMEDTDAYWLTRNKSAFAVGTVSIDDFEEFTNETINELADFIINELLKF